MFQRRALSREKEWPQARQATGWKTSTRLKRLARAPMGWSSRYHSFITYSFQFERVHFQGRNKKTNEIVAMKKIRLESEDEGVSLLTNLEPSCITLSETRCLQQQSARSPCWKNCNIQILCPWRMCWCRKPSSISSLSSSLWTSRSTWTQMCQRLVLPLLSNWSNFPPRMDRWTQCLWNLTPTSCCKDSFSATSAGSFTGANWNPRESL